MGEMDDFWGEQPQKKVSFLTLEELKGKTAFSYDVKEGPWGRLFQSAFAEMSAGTKLRGDDALIVGSRALWPPTQRIRVVVFADHAHVAPESMDDPWRLACVEGGRFFTLAATCDYLKVHQLTIVEVPRERLAQFDEVLLDDEAAQFARHLLEESFKASTPSYVQEPAFQELMGNRTAAEPETRFLACGSSDLEEPAASSRTGAGEDPLAEARCDEGWYSSVAAELSLDTLPDYHYIFEPEDGTYRVRALNHRLDGHPGLAYLEARKNAQVAFSKQYDFLLMQRLYSGSRQPVSRYERDMLSDRIWFGSFIDSDDVSVESDKTEEYLKEMREAYESAARQDPTSVLPRAVFDRLCEWFRRRSEGDLDACAREIDDACTKVPAPFRYEFSASFDYERKLARINVFLPARALFPLACANHDLARYPEYSSIELDEQGLNDRHAELACRMGIYTARLVKSKAPWVKRIQVNGLYRELSKRQLEGARPTPCCLYSFEIGEDELTPSILEHFTSVFDIMHDISARVHRTRERRLLAIDPLFAPEDALDFLFGCESYRDGWTVPYRCQKYSEHGSAEELAFLTTRMEDLLDRGELERGRKIGLALEEKYRREWLDDVPAGVRALSCNSVFEEKLARELLQGSTEKLRFLPQGLSHFFVVYGNICYEMEQRSEALEHLAMASELNPAFPEPFFGRIGVAFEDEDYERADELAGEAFEVAYLARDMAQVYRCWASIAMQRGESDVATSLFNFALAVSQDRQTVRQSVRDLGLLHAKGDTGTDADADPVSTLIFNGYPIHASEKVYAASKDDVEDALLGGPLPDPSVLAAYVNSRNTTEPLAEELKQLMLNVMGDAFADAPLDSYLLRPVIVDSLPALDLLGEGSELIEPQEDDGKLAVLAVPFVNAEGELRFHVAATVDRDDHRVVRSLDMTKGLDISAWGCAYEHFLLARPCDYPELEPEDRCALLGEVYRAPREREDTRSVRALDRLRDFEHPDDVLVVLRWAGTVPEAAWARLEYVNDDHQLVATLMTEPFDEFSIHSGDLCVLRVVRDWQIAGGVVAFVEPPDLDR